MTIFAKTAFAKALAEWLFERQGGRCYLAISPECLHAGRRMHSLQFGKGGGPRGWTWEHVIPRAHTQYKARGIRLLACSPCNQAKGAQRPTRAQLDLAVELHREYYEYRNQPEQAALVAEIAAAHRCVDHEGAEIAASDFQRSIEAAIAESLSANERARAEAVLGRGNSIRAAELGMIAPRFTPGAKRR